MTRRNAPTIEPARGSKIRCAIYTRKSTEEGLDQEFNSLDAQREACASYVLSQRHEGWTLVPEFYDDGGFSGGNMERPGLKQLLDDVKAGRVNVIVVYKVDRLTRALSDFAKIVDVLDEAGASFVSITQSFNTTMSMGRLTLNVLLSFAQFEREVISERVRDKIAASKRKGMWMGGNIPLGYDVRDRKLVINELEADVVRHIFQRYVMLGNVRLLVADLARDGIRAKVHRNEEGTIRGGRPLTAGPLYHILANRIYRGEVAHKGQIHPGEQEAIVSAELWEDVHNCLASNRSERGYQNNASDPSLLAGMIQDGEGRRMTPSHASKSGVRYRYYVSVDAEAGERPRAIRIAAADIERGIAAVLTRLLTDRATLLAMFEEHVVTAISADELLRSAALLSASLSSDRPSRQHRRFDRLCGAGAQIKYRVAGR
jgi:DNA invertase Pin-like site-specific DNA recombinase